MTFKKLLMSALRYRVAHKHIPTLPNSTCMYSTLTCSDAGMRPWVVIVQAVRSI